MKKKVSQILLSLTMVLTMAFSIMPTNLFAANNETTPSPRAGDVVIDETNFPDATFRDWVKLFGDKNGDSKLSPSEIEGVTWGNLGNRGISSLIGIEHFTAMTGLDCYNNQLTSLDLSQNTSLTALDCNNNELTSLDVSKNTVLTELDCSRNQLTSLDLSQNTSLTTLYCNNNELTSLDVSKNTALTELDCSENQLTSLGLSQNTSLTTLYCNNNELTSLDVSKNTALTKLISSSQTRTIAYDKNKGYMLSAYDAGFDKSKASDFVGATLKGDGTLTGVTKDTPITYDYDTGNANFTEKMDVSLTFTETLTPTDGEKLDEAKPLAEKAITDITTTNDTTAGNILDAVTNGISSVDGVTASWMSGTPTITPATKGKAGSITGTIVLTSGSNTVEVTVNKVINKLPVTDNDKLAEAKPLAEKAITDITATNDTTVGNILDAVTNGISSVDGVTASWMSGTPTITPATKDKAGSITGTIVLTSGSNTVEVTVNKVINKLPVTDDDKLAEAKPLAEKAITDITATNDTTAGNILDAVTNGISSVDGVTASWMSGSPTITAATKDKAGSIIGTIVLTSSSNTVEVTVNKVINKLPVTDDKLAEAKPLAEKAITDITTTNDTTAGNILDAVTNGISSVDGVTASWMSATPTITAATKDKAGSITGTIVLISGGKTIEISINKTINKLPTITDNNTTIVDKTTGTKVEYVDGSTFNDDITLVVSPKSKEEMNKLQENVNKVVTDKSIAGVYDIKLLKNGVEIQPNGKLKITLTLTDEMKAMSDLQVVYIDDNGKVTIIPSQLIDGKLVFITDHFSYYGVIGKEKSTVEIQPETPSKPSSPQTGDNSNAILYLGLIIFSGCIVGYGFKKKKALRK